MLKTIKLLKNYQKIFKNVYFIGIFKKVCSSVAENFFKILVLEN